MDGKTLRLTLTIAALAGAIFLILLWQPSRQVRLHQQHLLRAVEKRDWTKVSGFIGAQYRDRWEHDKENVLDDAKLVFSHYFLCNLESEERGLDVLDGAGTIAQKLTLNGKGSPFVDIANHRVNTLTEPFVFKWRQQSWKPWDWALVEVDQPQLELGNLPSL